MSTFDYPLFLYIYYRKTAWLIIVFLFYFLNYYFFKLKLLKALGIEAAECGVTIQKIRIYYDRELLGISLGLV